MEWSDLKLGSIETNLTLGSKFPEIRKKSNLLCFKGFFSQKIITLL